MAAVKTRPTSVTDTEAWRDFCRRAAGDLTLLDTDPDGVLAEVVGEKTMRERRYERVTELLAERFGDLSEWTILELGGGYGGQAASILRRYETEHYYFADLPEPLDLQLHYLEGYRVRRWQGESVDLFLSSFALSELRRDLQLDWLETAAKVPRGFVYWNGWTTDWVPLGEFAALIHSQGAGKTTVTEPDPDEERNRIITWEAT